jgi:hypothetical protein
MSGKLRSGSQYKTGAEMPHILQPGGDRAASIHVE